MSISGVSSQSQWAQYQPASKKIPASSSTQPQKSLRELYNNGAFDKADRVTQYKIQSILQIELMDANTHLTVQQGQGVQRQLDVNKDGNLTKSELSTSLDTYHNFIAANSHSSGQTVAEKLNQMLFASDFGKTLLDNYDSISNLDGKTGISKTDIQKLGGQQGDSRIISGLDIYKASNAEGYADYQMQKSQLAQRLQSEFGYILACPL